MPRRQSATLTEAELKIMEVLWQRKSGTVQQVLDDLPQKPALAYNSVLTIIRILEKKGYVGHAKDGRAHIYAPVIEREAARRSEVRHLAGRFFKNSQEQLVLNILEERGLDRQEIERLKLMLEKSEKGSGGR